MTANRIEKRMLDRVKDEFDRREGSVIYDATAPASVEFAELYILADVILKQAFATTADREFLILRAAEFNIYPEPATQGEFEAQFNMEVPIGSRFNYNEYNFVVTELIDDTEHKYKIKCEQYGRTPNATTGDITPIQGINGLTSAKILKISRLVKMKKTQKYSENGTLML